MPKRILQDYTNISLKPADIGGSLDFDIIFGRSAPVHIEIGSGRGTFLVSQAAAYQEINFLGIEWTNKCYRYSVDRIGRHGLGNIRIIRTDALDLIDGKVPDWTVDFFHIYFPDPWPKRRHHRHRLLSPDNIDAMTRCLRPHGIINVATDHSDYFEQIKTDFTGFFETGRLRQIPFIRTAGAGQNETTGTNYERKYIKQNRTIYTIAAQKPQTAPA